jgi:hypothetical protein
MSSDQPTPISAPRVRVEGFSVSVPADVIASALATGTPSSNEPIQVDLGGLNVSVPATLLQSLASQLVEGHTVTLSFFDGGIRLQLDNLPGLRLEFPADGLNIRADATGLRLLGTGA